MARLDDLNVTHLRTFQRVIQAGGYAAAARNCQLSVPSIWQHIRALETVYGVKLFERSGRTVRPTNAARQLHQMVESILVHLDSTFEIVSGLAEDQTIRLVAGARMMLEELGHPLAEFQKTHPNSLVIRHGNDRRAEELLFGDQADLALTLEPSQVRRSPQIHYEPAYTVEFLAVGKRSHPFFKSASTRLAELAKHDLVVTLTGTHGRDALNQAFDREGLSAKIVAETDNSAFTIACVSAGMGIGILAGRPTGTLCKKLATRSLSRQLGHCRIVLMWRKGRLLTNPMIELVEQFKRIDA